MGMWGRALPDVFTPTHVTHGVAIREQEKPFTVNLVLKDKELIISAEVD